MEHPAADRAASYGLPRIVVDGNDADVVYRTAMTAYEKARAGGGPSLIECMTYRYSGHSRADPAKYRPDGELEKWKERDPIKIYRERLKQFGIERGNHPAHRDRREARSRRGDRAVQGGAAAGARYPHHRRLCRRRFRMAELTYRDAVIRGIAQEMTRDPDVVFLGEDIGKAGGVFKATVGLYEQFGPVRVRDTPISEQAILGAAMGAAMTGSKADRRDHVLGLHRGVLRLYRQRIPQEPLHVERPGQVSAGRAHRQRRRRALRRAAFAERRELVHDDPGTQGRGAIVAARCDRADGGGRARSRSGDFLRAQIALCDQGRGAGRRDRRHARHARRSCGRARTPPFSRWR